MAAAPRRKRYQHLKKNTTHSTFRGRCAQNATAAPLTVQLPQPPQRWKRPSVDSSKTTGNGGDSIRNSADPVVGQWIRNMQPPIGHERAIRNAGLQAIEGGGYRLFGPNFEATENPLMALQRYLAASTGQFVGGEDHQKLSDPNEMMFDEAELKFMHSIVDYLYV